MFVFSVFFFCHCVIDFGIQFSCILEDTELQCVPERFESMDEYVRVFEPLLFEECRAQLYSSWEESCEANSYMKVRIKFVERRERGNNHH